MPRKLTVKQFILKAAKKHNNKYSYTKSNYTINSVKIEITCPEHGSFWQLPSSHLQGKGCPKCGRKQSAKYATKSNKQVINDFIKVHKDKYDYSKINYISAQTKITIICPTHGEFEQSPCSHLTGRGCPSCAKSGFDPTQSAILYYLKVTTEDNQELYKIGITNKSVNERFNLTDLKKIEIVKQKVYELGADALAKETEIKRKFKEFQYNGPNILSSGNTELFTCNIFELL